MGAIVFEGPKGVETYRAIVLKHGLLLYAKTKMRPGRSWTPMRMLSAASSITGIAYRRGQYVQAANDLSKWLEDNRG